LASYPESSYSFRDITQNAPFKGMNASVRAPVSQLGAFTTNTNDDD